MRLAHGEVRPELRLLEDDADALAELRAWILRVVPEHRHLACRPSAVALENLDRRRLAGAVRAEQAEHLALVDVEVDPADGFEIAVGLVEAANGDRAHSSSTKRMRARRERRLVAAGERGNGLAAVRLVADDDHRLAAAHRGIAQVEGRRAGREPLVDLGLAEAQRLRGLARPQQRARDDRVSREALLA